MSMKNQKLLQYFVFFSCLMLGLFLVSFRCYAQSPVDEQLAVADSLFDKRQYTESFGLYDQLYRKSQMASPAMLIKMAFIQESRGNYPEALYYLNEYFLLTADEQVVRKMQRLSEEHNLRGYEYTDYDLFYTYFREYRYLIIYILAGLAMVGLVYLAFTRQRRSKPYGWGVTYLVILGLLFVLTNYSLKPPQAIIMSDYTYVMNAPSSGAEVVYVSEKGHRVDVGKQQDVWTQIEWEGEPAFVRQGNLRTIRP